MNIITYLFRRSRHHWLLLLTLIFGVLMATTFLASGPVLLDALMEYGLRRTLLNANLREDVFYLTVRESSNQGEYQAMDDQVQGYFRERLNHLDINLIPTGYTGLMYPWQNGEMSIDRRLTLGFYGTDLDELVQHVEFVAGSFPDGDRNGTVDIPVFIGTFLADDLAIQVGDRLPVSINARSEQSELYLRITGIIAPKDYLDPYWKVLEAPFFMAPLSLRTPFLTWQRGYIHPWMSVIPGKQI